LKSYQLSKEAKINPLNFNSPKPKGIVEGELIHLHSWKPSLYTL